MYRNNPMHFYLDLDDVLFDFSGRLLELHHSQDQPLALLPDGHIDLLTMSGCFTRQGLLQPIVDQGEYFWSTLPLLPWANELVDFLNAECPKKWSIASNPGLGTFPAAMQGKLMAVEYHFSGYQSVFLGAHKYELAGPHKCLIDDLQENVNDFQYRGGRAIKFHRTWAASDDPLPAVLRKIREYL